MHDDRDLDALLDEALSTYMDAEPDPSLRARVIRATEAAPARQFWIWASAAAIACAAVLVLALVPLHPRPQILAPKIATSASYAAAAPRRAFEQQTPVVKRARTARIIRHGSRIQSAALERPRFHASDDALTEEDRILLEFIAEHPKEAKQVLTPPPDQPVEIKPITIPPIEIADLSKFGDSEEQNQPFEK